MPLQTNRYGEKLRVLVTFEDTHKAYREFLARALQYVRPSLEVHPIGVSTFPQKLTAFDPHVVVCSHLYDQADEGGAVWVKMPLEGSASGFAELISIIDTTAKNLLSA